MNALVRYDVAAQPDDEPDPLLDAIGNRPMTEAEWVIRFAPAAR